MPNLTFSFETETMTEQAPENRNLRRGAPMIDEFYCSVPPLWDIKKGCGSSHVPIFDSGRARSAVEICLVVLYLSIESTICVKDSMIFWQLSLQFRSGLGDTAPEVESASLLSPSLA